jgi:hypothetical protein
MNAMDLFLQNSLKKYGLNPLHWKIQKVHEKKYKIANVHDDEFYFIGEADTTNKTPTWNSLVLASF